jgi:hypothetical protein
MLPAGTKMLRRKHQLYGPVMMQIAAFLENAVFWDITLKVNRRFGGKYRLHLSAE